MVAIIDYGSGNVRAFANMYSRLNIPAIVVKNKEELKHAKKIVLPGVGSFDWAMKKFSDSGMKNTISDMVINKKIPILGVCVGMQMMAMGSDEGNLPGLGWLNGYVKKFVVSLDGMPVPHMGWNDVNVLRDNPLVSEEENRFYFLHSYYFSSNSDQINFGKTTYEKDFISMAFRDNIFGVQFHPEKSHKSGMKLLENFAKF